MEDGGAAYSGRWRDILVECGITAGVVSSVCGVAMKEKFSSGNFNPASLNAIPTSFSLGKAA